MEGRRANAVHYKTELSALETVRLQHETGESSWFGFSLILEGTLTGRRAEVVAALRDADIESRPIVAGNFTRNPVMKYLDAVVPDALPAADKVHVDGLFVGNHPHDIADGIGALRDVLVRLG